MGMHGVTLGLVGLLTAHVPLPELPSSPEWSPGIGYAVSRLQRDRGAEATAEAPTTSLVPRLPPPPTDLQRVQGSPGARGLHVAAAMAAQLAMIVAGVIAVREQREQLRRERERAPAPYRPYR
ncbi:hypothetical protein [Paraliomyxa miuraensis]|uniref:hypothetical protein n=1 Tax=Paraliomyxa miuraensis TaxID=376150 RepID=UPI002252EDD6|nr:hypothetical protein [Paraliomyxa miuraensis]MCX4247400.1 hypothetical protein [Paraliomyxa miuraensis]